MCKKELITQGFLTDRPSLLLGPITIGGYYKAENGFWYNVSWRSGRFQISSVGKSAAYLNAERLFEQTHGAILDERSGAEFDSFLMKHLNAGPAAETGTRPDKNP